MKLLKTVLSILLNLFIQLFFLFRYQGKIIGKPTNSACESIHQVFASYASPNMMPRPLRHILAAKRRTSMLKTLENEFGNPVSRPQIFFSFSGESFTEKLIYFGLLLFHFSKVVSVLHRVLCFVLKDGENLSNKKKI